MIMRLGTEDVTGNWMQLKTALLRQPPIRVRGTPPGVWTTSLFHCLLTEDAQIWAVGRGENGEMQDVAGYLVTAFEAEDVTEEINLIVYTMAPEMRTSGEEKEFDDALIAEAFTVFSDFRREAGAGNVMWYLPTPKMARIVKIKPLPEDHVFYIPCVGGDNGNY